MLQRRFGVSERRACRVVGQSRSTQRLPIPIPPPADEALVTWLRSFALEHPRWGYKRAHSEANKQGWSVDRKRIQRLWRNAGLKVPYRKRKKPTHGKGVAMGLHQPTQTNVCWAMDVNGHLFIPGYGHINSSRAASFLARARPRFLLARGHGFSRHYCDLSQW